MLNYKNKKAFTLIELLVVIAIIGILATLAVVSLQNARKNARDAKRMADVKQIQTALELYFNDNSSYPLTSQLSTTIATGGVTYMSSVPKAPTPPDGNCTAISNNYTYTSLDGSTYFIDFCTGGNVASQLAGLKMATPSGIWSCGDVVTDPRDGNSYPTVQIGTQCWFAKNLAYLPMVHSNTQFATQGASSQPGYGVYGYDGNDINAAKAHQISGVNMYNAYGVLYNWSATMSGTTTEGAKGACPSGWHIPTDAEFTTLENYLGGATVAGGKMKVIITCGTYPCWNIPNTGATNESGFSAWGGGYRLSDGSFHIFGYYDYFWSSSISVTVNALLRRTNYDSTIVNRQSIPQTYGFSVRCLKN